MVKTFYNTELLSNIHYAGTGIRVHCNVSSKRCTNDVETLDGYGNMWMGQGGITNIMYLARVSEI